MIPLTTDPTVVVYINSRTGTIAATATNVADDLKVVLVYNRSEFEGEAAGKPFNTLTAAEAVKAARG